ncbi:hypothetical protein FRX31_003529 [Thalictrum thalictroides]|uniref:Uncharacterized protein n=1 Tax=Thalictrum thalictroides TaxID=46969 RepID=A0A7J6XAV1_THATH|nr:hypothetical protein FRX31_003529 [Thalictrum thalictroides]
MANFLRIAIFAATYIGGYFPGNYFNDKSVHALDTRVKKLIPMHSGAWMEKGE